MEDFNMPQDIEDELHKLRNREKTLSLIVGGFLLAAVLFGFKVYFSDPVNAQQNTNTYQSIPLTAGTAGSIGTAGSTGAAGAGGCCGGGSITGPKLSNDKLAAKALELYKKETGKTDGKAQVSDRGCHIQIDIVDAKGNILKSYGYKGGNEVYPIV